mgnify:CR=1 FL=1
MSTKRKVLSNSFIVSTKRLAYILLQDQHFHIKIVTYRSRNIVSQSAFWIQQIHFYSKLYTLFSTPTVQNSSEKCAQSFSPVHLSDSGMTYFQCASKTYQKSIRKLLMKNYKFMAVLIFQMVAYVPVKSLYCFLTLTKSCTL